MTNKKPKQKEEELEKRLIETQIELIETRNRLSKILKSRTYKTLLVFRKIYDLLFPKDSIRFELVQGILRALNFVRTRGFEAFLYKIWSHITRTDGSKKYRLWIEKNEPTAAEIKKQHNYTGILQLCPLISIIMPVFNTPENVLRDTLNSVLNQSYVNWELCIANGSLEKAILTDLLKEYQDKDNRIHINNLDKNFGIADNTNAAIALSKGEYVAFLDHDDILAPFALFEIVKAINSYPKTDVFFSDEDKFSANGKNRYGPDFKSAFNLEFLRAVNYMCHFLVVRKSIGDEVGWLRGNFEGAQDFDFILRVLEKSKWVTHIPKILYHWRAIAGSTAHHPDAKNYAADSGVLALKDHLKRLGIPSKVKQIKSSTNYHITYQFDDNPLVSIIIPNHNHSGDLDRCISSVFSRSTYLNFEILIIENNSNEEETFLLYEQYKKTNKIRVIEYNQPFNYSRINNFGENQSSGNVVLLLNNDTEVISPDWIQRMLEYALQPGIGAVGAKLHYPNGYLQHGGVVVGPHSFIASHMHKGAPSDWVGYRNRLILPQHVSAVTAACLMTRKEVFNQVSGFDETYELAFGDIDLCMKMIAAGFLNVWTPYAELFHYESQTRGYEDTPEKQNRFSREAEIFKIKWSHMHMYKECDPYYNPNLNPEGDFNISLTRKKKDYSNRCLPVVFPSRKDSLKF